MGKFGMLLGAGVGYVLGTRDGRERYDQIREQAQKLWKNPKVQQKKDQAAEAAKQKGGQLQDKVSEKTEKKSTRSQKKNADSSSGFDSAFSSDSDSPPTPATVAGMGTATQPHVSPEGGTTGGTGTSPDGGTHTGPQHA